MTRAHFHAISLFAFLLVTACTQDAGPPAAAADPEVARLGERASRVEIIRDDFGVPHIYGKSDADAVFGMLYAQAEDDFPRIERNYVWATGRLAEIEGENAIFSDLRARLYMTVDEAKAAYASAPDWLRALCDAWADGLNYYLLTHPEVKPKLLTRFDPWMPMFFSEGSIGGDIEQVPLDRIAGFYGGTDAGAGTAAARMVEEEFAPPGGSNGFAISGERTESGNAMLLINPHTSFYFRGEVHVVSEEGLDAYGAVTWGQFFVYQGFNEKTGWMHTSTYVDFIDEFVEDVSEVDGKLVYRYGEETRPVEVSEVTLEYKDGDGFGERTFTVYRTHHGPVTHEVDGKWAVTRINWDPVNALIQSYTRTKLANYDEFREMMNIRTNSSNNTVFADAEGNIAYFHGNFIPKRDARFDFSQPVAGSDPATDWLGLHTVDEAITILNPPNGWIQNANSTPFTAAAEFSPKRADYPAYMAPDNENFRGVHAVRVLTDADDLTLDSLIELAHDPYLPGFEKLVGGLLEAWDQAVERDAALAEPIAVLREWDLATGEESVAMSLAHFYGMNYLERGVTPEGLSEMEAINYLGTEASPADRLEVFAETVAMLANDFGDWRIPWGEINRFQRLSGAIDLEYDDDKPSLAVGMANSRWGALADFGAKRREGTKRLYGDNGNSFVAVVEFGDKVTAKSILVGGQSNDPDSPHFDDQAPLYVKQQFKDVAYYREDVERRAAEHYVPGRRGAAP
ncbi:MAG: acylase [Gammaproteobacteria bacterium]|nr:acylase [Gammaproteobacteria bacterium]